MLINRANKYCPKCDYDASVVGNICTVDFGTVLATASVGSATTSSTTDKGSWTGEADVGCKFGRALSVKSDTAATTQKVTVRGYDMYDQPMAEEFTLNGTTAVAGKKAFKTVCEIEVAAGAAQTVTVSTSLLLGLPFRTTKLLAGTKDGADDTTNETLTAGVKIVGTATSGDPRGTITVGSISTSGVFEAVVVVCKDVFTLSSKDVGGLQGIPHYFA